MRRCCERERDRERDRERERDRDRERERERERESRKSVHVTAYSQTFDSPQRIQVRPAW